MKTKSYEEWVEGVCDELPRGVAWEAVAEGFWRSQYRLGASPAKAVRRALSGPSFGGAEVDDASDDIAA